MHPSMVDIVLGLRHKENLLIPTRSCSICRKANFTSTKTGKLGLIGELIREI